MSEHELEKLLGGFAADQLTPEERQKLFTAALQDQELFNALADEQVLKEMLADPAVRRRLLQTLGQPHGAGGRRSWLDRFTRPAGLAWAGGVAAGVFAVVLGLNVYQQSLRRASEPAALEEGRPAPPLAVPPSDPPAQEPLIEKERKETKVAPAPESATKNRFTKTLDSREQAAASRPRKEPASSIEEDKKQKLRQKEASQKSDAPIAALGESSEQAGASDQRSAPESSSTERTDTDILLQADSGTTISASARALFYGQGSVVQEPGLRSEEKQAEPARKPEQFAFTRKALEKTAPVKPLALRYSFVIRESSGEREVNAVNTAETVTLSVESNQEAYIQVWTRTGDSLPELMLPAKETGRISLKTVPGQRQQMTVPRETDRLILRLSRVPFGPITRQEAVMAGRGGSGQLMESASGTEEQAIYVANPNLSAAELAIEIPLRTKALR